MDAAVASGFARRPLSATGPTGLPVDTAWARSGVTAVVELADVCGLVRLPDGPRAAIRVGPVELADSSLRA